MPDPIVIVREPNPPAVVRATSAEPVVVRGTGIQGPAGPRGPAGPGDDPVVYRQSIAASTWSVPWTGDHRPQVDVADDLGNRLLASVDVPLSAPWSPISIVHTTALTGYVYLA